MKILYDYEYVPTILAFAQDDSFVRGLMGPFGSGKSSGCVLEIYRRSLQQQPCTDGVMKGIRCSRWAVVRNTNKELEDTAINTFMQWIPFGEHKWQETKKNLTMDFTDDKGRKYHIEIMFRALDKIKQVKDLLSLELTGAWINEAREVPWVIIDTLMGRVGRYPRIKDGGCTWYGLILDTNAPDDDSKWFEYFEETRPENAAIFKQPSGLSDEAENIPNLPPGYYKNLAIGKDAEYVKVYIDGNYGFVQDGKPIYTEYNDTLHCREFSTPPGTIIRGWDFGLTPACIFLNVTVKGQLRIFDEMIATDMGADKFSDEVLMHSSKEYSGRTFEDWGDPAGNTRADSDESTCFGILWGKNIEIEEGKQSPRLRIESVKYPMTRLVDGEPAFLLHPRCKKLRKGFQGRYRYRRMATAGERYSDKPDKNDYSHPHDALQYPCTMIFGPRLKGKFEEIPEAEDLTVDNTTFNDLLERSIELGNEHRQGNNRI